MWYCRLSCAAANLCVSTLLWRSKMCQLAQVSQKPVSVSEAVTQKAGTLHIHSAFPFPPDGQAVSWVFTLIRMNLAGLGKGLQQVK